MSSGLEICQIQSTFIPGGDLVDHAVNIKIVIANVPWL